MRAERIFAGLMLTWGLGQSLLAAPPVYFEDAALHAIQFVDRNEGWAAGDEGVVWHTIDGGKTWERQPTGVRASLRAMQFLTPFTGYIVGREDLPNGQSAGVVLFTSDGGIAWKRLAISSVPGLNAVHFFDDRNGYAAGESCDAYPSGVFRTSDGGQTWQAVPGPRSPLWHAACFPRIGEAALVGAWGRLNVLRNDSFLAADSDTLGGRSLRAICMDGTFAIAAGEGGAVLVSPDSSGVRWGFVRTGLSRESQVDWDFNALAMRGSHVWAAGRPGSAILYSPDRGRSWKVMPTGATVPLRGLCFINPEQGWAVGELGTILATNDGGRTWTEQRSGGRRSAILCVSADPAGIPLETVAVLGGEEGYLSAALCVVSPDLASASPNMAHRPARLASVHRDAYGAAAETLWQFPLPAHLEHLPPEQILAAWDKFHDGQASQHLLRQLVLALRTWRPEVVICDAFDPQSPTAHLISEAMKVAFKQAADASAFPEQMSILKLTPWQAKRLLIAAAATAVDAVGIDVTQLRPRLGDSAGQLVSPLWTRLGSPAKPARKYRVALTTLPNGPVTDLMAGIDLGPGGTARRELIPWTQDDHDEFAKIVKALQHRNTLAAVASGQAGAIASPEQALAQVGELLTRLPTEQAVRAGLGLAGHYVRAGQWSMARELYLLTAERFPAHPATLEAYTWLARYQSSSEARRRHELGQFVEFVTTKFESVNTGQPNRNAPMAANEVRQVGFTPRTQRSVSTVQELAGARKWYEGALLLEPRFAAYGSLFAADPALGFCMAAAHRALGNPDAAVKFCNRIVNERTDIWRDLATAELSVLTGRGAIANGQPSRPTIVCRTDAGRPHLDGKLDDACWQERPTRLRNAVGAAATDHPTDVRVAYDAEHLYFAVECLRPASQAVLPLKPRTRDAINRQCERVEFLIDLDRDYQTAYRLVVDEAGRIADDCWGDVSWNPRWFVAVNSTPEGWTAEIAIPLMELTGEKITTGRVWAFNVSRIVPGVGVQAWSIPAEARPRLEGMGLLQFNSEAKPEQPRALPKLD